MEGLAGALGLAGLLDGRLAELLLGERGGVRVEAEHDLLVLERVLLLDARPLGLGVLGGAQHRLDLRRVDQAADVGVGDDVGRQDVVLLSGVDVVEGAESGRRPDDEAAKVTTGSELEEVEGVHGAGLDTGDVAEGLDKRLAVGLRVVDDERAAALAEAAVTELTLTGTDLAGLLDLGEVGTGAEGLEEGDGSLGLGDGVVLEGFGVDDERDLGDLSDAVAAGEEEGGDGRSSQGRGSSEAPECVSIQLHRKMHSNRGYLTSDPG